MSTDPVFSEVQKINPSAIIELFTLQLDSSYMVRQQYIDFMLDLV